MRLLSKIEKDRIRDFAYYCYNKINAMGITYNSADMVEDVCQKYMELVKANNDDVKLGREERKFVVQLALACHQLEFGKAIKTIADYINNGTIKE